MGDSFPLLTSEQKEEDSQGRTDKAHEELQRDLAVTGMLVKEKDGVFHSGIENIYRKLCAQLNL